MGRVILIVLISCLSLSQKASAQSEEMQQLILNIEKLAQFKSILEDMKKGYDILVQGYNAVKDISEGNFSLHKIFLDGWMEVSPTVRQYKMVGDIINYQIILVKEYKTALKNFRISQIFSTTEIGYLDRVYKQLLDESLNCLQDLVAVLTAGQFRMNDADRIREIDYIYVSMVDKLSFLRSFNNSTSVLAVQRLKEKRDINIVRKFHAVD